MLIARPACGGKDVSLFRDLDAAKRAAEGHVQGEPAALDALRRFAGHVLDLRASSGARVALVLAPVR